MSVERPYEHIETQLLIRFWHYLDSDWQEIPFEMSYNPRQIDQDQIEAELNLRGEIKDPRRGY